jgi:5'-phosphate synthase pdxT subunit
VGGSGPARPRRETPQREVRDGAPPTPPVQPVVGVLALQGGFEAHARMLRRVGADVREVRTPADLDGIEGLVIPGGESTTMTLGIEREGLAEPLRALARPGAVETPRAGIDGTPPTGSSETPRADADGTPRAGAGGIPVLGSCAGLIMLDREHLGVMDIRAQRNAFGPQIRSFEADVSLRGVTDPPAPPLRGVFIRAPWIVEHGPAVEILAEVDGHAVAAREGDVLAVAFHSELTEDVRVHQLFLDAVLRRRRAARRMQSPS